jgi:hypothetical protein
VNKISYPELIKEIIKSYRYATHTVSPITVGDMSQKITKAIMGNTYKSVIYNTDNSMTLIDQDSVEH